MSLEVASWFRRQARPATAARRPRSGACAGCGAERGAARGAGVQADGGPFVCPACGALSDAAGNPLAIEPAGARLVLSCEPSRDSAAAPPAPLVRAVVAERVLRRLADAGAVPGPGDLGGYLARVVGQVGGNDRAPVLLLDEGEPLSMPLPGGGTVLSLGLLASLEDEAQLAFLVAREIALERAGWPSRRFGRVLSETPRWLAVIRPGRAESELLEAIELSLRVGYGAEAEAFADGRAIEAVRAARYDVPAAVRAPFVLERSSLPGRSVRFLLDEARRQRLLVEASRPAAPGRVDREVYRRAIGGFAVFSFVRGS